MFSSLFKRQPKLPEMTLDMYAIYPVFLMLEERPPFDDWKASDCNLEPALEEFSRGYVLMYQMYTYYILTANRFGYDIADKVTVIQAERLGKASEELGRQLRLAINEIHDIVSRYVAKPPAISHEDKNVSLPVELAMAWQFLTLSEESPFHTTKTAFNEKGVPDYREQDFALAACLEHGKQAALREFQSLVEEAKVVL